MRCSVWLILGALGCGSVANGKLPDAGPGGDGPGNDGPPRVPPGTIRWVRSLSSLEGLGVADGPGGLTVAGAISAPANLGGQALVPAGAFDMVVAGFDAETADHVFSVRHGDVGSEFGFLHHEDSNGAPMVYGVSYGNVDLGLGPMTGGSPANTNLADGYIGRFGPAAPAWIARIVRTSGAGENKILASAPGPGSTIYAGGYVANPSTFNVTAGTTTTPVTTLASVDGRDIFLARFNTFTGAVDLTKQYSGTPDDEITGAASSAGGLVVTGRFGQVGGGMPQGSLSFGGATQPLVPNGGLDIFVAKLDDTGAGMWAVHYGGTGDEFDPRISVDTAGDVYVAGSFSGQVAFGTTKLTSKGGQDIFIAKLHGNDGSVVWAQSIGSTVDDGILDIAADTAGHIVVVGTVGGPIDNGTSAGGIDALIATFDAANGTPGWRKVLSTAMDDRSFAVTFGRNGDIYALVNLPSPYDFGVPVIGAASYAAVLLRIAP
jgi:hypothetical protein